MDILSYLSELIQTRKTLGITGLGTVYKKKLPGRYDAATHAFLPPSYTLHFTSEIKEDTLLPAYISKQRNVSEDTSKYFINEFSESLLKELNDNHEAQFGDLGRLVKTGDEIILEPSEKLNYGFDFYGLPSIKANEQTEEETTNSIEQESAVDELIPEIEDVEDPATEEPKINNSYPLIEEVEVEELDLPEENLLPEPEEEPTIESVIADNEGLEENPGDDEINKLSPLSIPELEEVIANLNAKAEETAIAEKIAPVEVPLTYPADVYPLEPENKTTPLYLKLILALSIIAMMMVVAYFVKPEWFNFLTGNSTAPVHHKVQPALIPPLDTTKRATPPLDTANLRDSQAVSVVSSKDTGATLVPAKPASDSTVVYEIIGASMHDQKEANGFIAQMKKSGINAKVVTNMSGRRLKMSIATLKDEASAQLEMKRLADKLKIKGMYIYKNKQK